MKEINYWKIAGLSFGLIAVLYLITYLLSTVAAPGSLSVLWAVVYGWAIFITSIYSYRKTGSKKEFGYLVIIYFLIATLPLPIIIVTLTGIHFAFAMIRVKKTAQGL